MTLEKRIRNIQHHEATLDKFAILIHKLEDLNKEWEEFHSSYNELMDYYSSSQWMKDKEDSDKGLFDEVKCGVLSEDAVYNLFQCQKSLSIDLIKIALKYLEN